MSSFAKPTVVVSKCLGFEACRFDGRRLCSPFVQALKPYVNFVPVCPEVRIGLGTPREPIELVRTGSEISLCQPTTGRNLTRTMNAFAHRFLSSQQDVDGFILKGRSPSCGIGDVRIRSLTDNHRTESRHGSGVFAAQVLKRCGDLAVTTDSRLARDRAREHWLTGLFTLAAFRLSMRSGSMKRLVAFHRYNRHLLAACNQGRARRLDAAMRACDRKHPRATFAEYQLHLRAAMSRPPRRASVRKILAGALDYYSTHLDASERHAFSRSLERYCQGEFPLSALRKTLQVWAVRYDKTFLRSDSFFRPYPGELADINSWRKSE
ncbi:MAG TPA: DUF523 and DUF1722 domain-containing protein [Acidobacteriota bacterium]|nr:DUF523 and DUF1722 domain-containing protein [Acidobacteriota bacterium]